ncbi:hypothetical protein RJ639_017275 [Escallonia herrerae]|uniref:Uncharacterized protein n=1 Tax=Escallonia herrerae TaxID=1293975 RepID=A0AA89AMD7_9ASTE|nr:hypothetical protein RJ639_017275 [Escallonia herrerae]
MSVGAKATLVVTPVNEEETDPYLQFRPSASSENEEAKEEKQEKKVIREKCMLYLVCEFAAGDHACKIYPIEVGPGAQAKGVPSLRPPTAPPKPVISFSFVRHASPMLYPKYDPTIVGPIRGVWDDRDPDVKETWRCFVIGDELASHDFEALDVQFFHSGREPTSRWTSLPQPPVSRVERPPLWATATGHRIYSHAIIEDNSVILLATSGEGVFSYRVSECIWTRVDCSSPGPGPSTRIILPFRQTDTFFGPLGAYIACSSAYYPGIGRADYCAFRPYGPEPECLIAHEGKSAPKGSYDKIPVSGLLTMPLSRVDDVFVSNLGDERGVCVVRHGVDHEDYWGFGSNKPFDLTRVSRPLVAIDVFYPSMNPSSDAITAKDQFSVSIQIGVSWFPLVRVRACLPVQVLHGTAGGMSPQVQARNQQHSGPAPDKRTEMNPNLNPRAAGPEESLIGIPGTVGLIFPSVCLLVSYLLLNWGGENSGVCVLLNQCKLKLEGYVQLVSSFAVTILQCYV